MAKDPIKKADNGTYYFRANLGYDSKGKKIQKQHGGFKTKKEAKEAYARVILEKNNPNAPSDSTQKLTFKGFIDDIFLPWYKTQVKERTYEHRKLIINKHFEYFFKFELTKLKPIHVQSWQLELSQTLKSSSVRTVQHLLSMCLDRAIILGLMNENPSKIIGNVKKEKTKIEFWTADDFKKVLKCMDTNDYYQHFMSVAFRLLFMTGMRIGEGTAIHWEDINFKTGQLTINKSLYYKNREDYTFSETKTKASNRTIVLDEDTLTMLKEWKKVQGKVVKTELVMSYNGFPNKKDIYGNAITQYAEEAGVHRITVHGMRHSHVALLISMGENPLLIKERLGHEDIQTTLGTYGHLYPNSNFEVAQKLKGVLLDKEAKSA